MRNDRTLIIPVFLSYMGCLNRCVFCSQTGITENDSNKSTDELDDRVRRFLLTKRPEDVASIAFYGGTFTSIPIEIQEKYLMWANTWIEKGMVRSLRLSTRPDEISEENVRLLKKYRVSTVEIGIQSFDEKVLSMNRRTYTHETIVEAVDILKKHGMVIGFHLMTGLLSSDKRSDIVSLAKAIEEAPDFLRIHPTLVLRETTLYRYYLEGKYVPPGLFETLDLCSDMSLMCENARIPIVRFGLFIPQKNRDQVVAGPYHPAFGDLVKKMAFLKKSLPAFLNDHLEDTVLKGEIMRTVSSHHDYLRDWFIERTGTTL